jgi:hypothetical protein
MLAPTPQLLRSNFRTSVVKLAHKPQKQSHSETEIAEQSQYSYLRKKYPQGSKGRETAVCETLGTTIQ